MDERTIIDPLRSLPADIVANYIYPFAVKVIQNREELIVAVDEYLDEFYSSNGGARNYNENVGNSRIRYPIGDWDVSRVDNFTSVLDAIRNPKARHFNEDLSRWNVSNGTSFARMFYGCRFFQSDLSNWNINRATDLSRMFFGCNSFNSDLSRWNVANADNLSWMFYGCTSFNVDLSRWNVANATNLGCMFFDCTSFNSDVSRWEVANAQKMANMFCGCTSFSSNVSQWDVVNAIGRMAGMFHGCDSFDRTYVATWPLPDRPSVAALFR
jgi:surface protein